MFFVRQCFSNKTGISIIQLCIAFLFAGNLITQKCLFKSGKYIFKHLTQFKIFFPIDIIEKICVYLSNYSTLKSAVQLII